MRNILEDKTPLVSYYLDKSFGVGSVRNGRSRGEVYLVVAQFPNFNVKADLFAHRSLDLFSDSMGVVAISANNVLSSATKHVDIADFYVRELVQSGVVTVSYVKTVYMVADVLTKALGPDKFFQFIGVIMGLLRSGARTADVRTLSSTEEGRKTAPMSSMPQRGVRTATPMSRLPQRGVEQKTTPMSSMPQRGVRTATPMSRLPQRGVESATAPMASLPSVEVTPKLPSNRESRKHARAANPRLGLMQTRLKR